MDKRIHIWILPISATIVVMATIFSGVFPFLIFFGSKGVGASLERKIEVSTIFVVTFLAGLYVCIGLYQMFFLELRRQFIARKVERWSDDSYRLRGYYFKKAEFPANAVRHVEEYRVNPRWFSKNIMTTLSRHHPNYKLTLKDGREFYLPGEMDRINDLVELLKKRS